MKPFSPLPRRRCGPIPSRVPAPAGAACVLSLVLLLVLSATGVCRAATIAGRVLTAEDADAIAPGAEVSLVFHSPGGQMEQRQTTADASGHFHFVDLAADTSIAYVLQIDYRGTQFLSAPIRFTPEEETIDYNIVLASDEPPMGEMPAGHPPLGGEPLMGRPVRPNAGHTLLLAAWVVLVFALLAALARRKGVTEDPALAPGARELVRDIASLDNRHADGVIGEEEYRKVRDGLMRRLKAIHAKGRHA